LHKLSIQLESPDEKKKKKRRERKKEEKRRKKIRKNGCGFAGRCCSAVGLEKERSSAV
jgi:hypothetical protein